MFNQDAELTPHHLPDNLRRTEPRYGEMGWGQFTAANDKWNADCNNYCNSHNLCEIWNGDHDAREAIMFNIQRLLENGSFVKMWKEPPFLWLLHHSDNANNYQAINAERISMLPADVQKIINGLPKNN